jgi:hypothetical protein
MNWKIKGLTRANESIEIERPTFKAVQTIARSGKILAWEILKGGDVVLSHVSPNGFRLARKPGAGRKPTENPAIQLTISVKLDSAVRVTNFSSSADEIMQLPPGGKAVKLMQLRNALRSYIHNSIEG